LKKSKPTTSRAAQVKQSNRTDGDRQKGIGHRARGAPKIEKKTVRGLPATANARRAQQSTRALVVLLRRRVIRNQRDRMFCRATVMRPHEFQKLDVFKITKDCPLSGK